MAVRLTQEKTEVLRDGSPLFRTTQVLAEVARSGSPLFRTTQILAEVARSGSPVIRVSQVVIEVLCRSFASNLASGMTSGQAPANHAYSS